MFIRRKRTTFEFSSSLGSLRWGRIWEQIIFYMSHWLSLKSPTGRVHNNKWKKLSGTGPRLSPSCVMSAGDSKEDIYLCENATDFYWGLVLCLETTVEQMTNTHKQLCLSSHHIFFHFLHTDQFILEVRNGVKEWVFGRILLLATEVFWLRF